MAEDMDPVDQRNVNAPVPPTGATAAWPSAIPLASRVTRLGVITGGSVTTESFVCVQPFSSVTVTVYVPGPAFIRSSVTELSDHSNVKAPTPPDGVISINPSVNQLQLTFETFVIAISITGGSFTKAESIVVS